MLAATVPVPAAPADPEAGGAADRFASPGSDAAFASAGLFALCASLALCLQGFVPWSSLWSADWVWWLGDAAGIMLVTPLVLRVKSVRPTWPRLRTSIEIGLLAALLAGILAWVFTDWLPPPFGTRVD